MIMISNDYPRAPLLSLFVRGTQARQNDRKRWQGMAGRNIGLSTTIGSVGKCSTGTREGLKTTCTSTDKGNTHQFKHTDSITSGEVDNVDIGVQTLESLDIYLYDFIILYAYDMHMICM
jgi:hypothetical protein